MAGKGMDCECVNEQGHLMIGECDTVDLAETYGTPLYVMDEKKIRENCRLYKSFMQKLYVGNFNVIYASKAFLCKEICRIIKDEGLYMDVVSGGELYTALKAEFPAAKIYFHGNNKTHNELEMAVKNDVGRIVVDNENEIDMLYNLAKKFNKDINILIRVKPGVEAHTHSFIRTGQIDSKFGFAIENGEAERVILKILNLNKKDIDREKLDRGSLNLKGLHCHIGSQILNPEPFKQTAEVMVEFINNLKKKLSIDIEELNLGGGFGIKYLPGQKELDYKECLRSVSVAILDKCKQYSLNMPKVSIEPGRSIVGEAGLTLYRVGNVKKIKDVRTYISIDGGMTDNPRYALYGAEYNVVNAEKMKEKREKTVTIAGKCCESGDLIQKDVKMCETKVGDIIAVLCTGAYNYSMASNYNRIPKPAVVMVNGGNSRIIVKRQTFKDLIAQDV